MSKIPPEIRITSFLLFILVSAITYSWQKSELQLQKRELTQFIQNEIETNDRWALISKLNKASQISNLNQLIATENNVEIFRFQRESTWMENIFLIEVNASNTDNIRVLAKLSPSGTKLILSFSFYVTCLALILSLLKKMNSSYDSLLEKETYFSMRVKQVAHDLRSPLSALKVSSKLIKDKDLLSLTTESIKRIDGICTNILEINKQLERQNHPLDLEKIFYHLSKEIPSNELKVTFPTELPRNIHAPISANDLTNILINLARNALQAGSKDVSISILTKPVGFITRKNNLIISVQDQGPGFSENVLAILGKHQITTKPDGNGIGLLTAYKIIKLAGGSIKIVNNNLGALVTIKIGINDA